jgi:Protein of unknown function (DUF3309)
MRKTSWDSLKAFAIELVRKKTKAEQKKSEPSLRQSVVARKYDWRMHRMRIDYKPMRFLLLIILILLLLAALPTWPYSTGWGYYPSGGLGLIVLIVLLVVLLR